MRFGIVVYQVGGMKKMLLQAQCKGTMHIVFSLGEVRIHETGVIYHK